MEEQRVTAEQVGDGSGKDGRITKGDVLAFLNRPAPAPPPAPAARPPRTEDAREQRVRMTRLRRTIAARLKEAQNTAAMLTTFNEVDMSAVMALRTAYREAFEKKHSGARLGFMSFFVRACCVALQEFPAVNAEIDGDDLVYKNFVNMGIAVGGPSGLVVPVVRDADAMSFADIERAIADFGKRVREGGLKLEELTGGTFSITNGGIYGSLMSTPILESAAVGDPGNAQDPGAAGRDRGQGRDPADDVPGTVIRPPGHRRIGSGIVPGAGEGGDRGSAPALVGCVTNVLIRHGPRAASRTARRPDHLSIIAFTGCWRVLHPIKRPGCLPRSLRTPTASVEGCHGYRCLQWTEQRRSG